jgi:SagB-type dehydrogenase family enzyme
MRSQKNSGYVIPVVIALISSAALFRSADVLAQSDDLIALPEPRLTGDVSVEEALQSRRSIRDFRSKSLRLDEVSQLLWAAQGVTCRRLRTAPSAGALYPLDVYVVAGRVEGLDAGAYRYDPQRHTLEIVTAGDLRKRLSRAAFGQEWVHEGAIALVFTAQYEQTVAKYGDRGIRYVHVEAGHAMQNVYLQAESLGLGTVTIGAFSDGSVKEMLQLDDEYQPLGIMPVGRTSP